MTIINNSNNKNNLINSKVLAKKIDNKIKTYDSLQNDYDKLIEKQFLENKGPTGGWKKMNGQLSQISGGGKDYLWGVQENGNIHKCKKPCFNNRWDRVNGSNIHVSAGESEVWGVNKKGNIYKIKESEQNDNWQQVKGYASNISQGKNYVWMVGKSSSYCEKPIVYGDKIVIAASTENNNSVRKHLIIGHYLSHLI